MKITNHVCTENSISLTDTEQKRVYIVNIVSPAEDKIKNVNVINASDEYPEDIENLIK